MNSRRQSHFGRSPALGVLTLVALLHFGFALGIARAEFAVNITYQFGDVLRPLPDPEKHRIGEEKEPNGRDTVVFRVPPIIYLDKDLNLTSRLSNETVYFARDILGYYGNLGYAGFATINTDSDTHAFYLTNITGEPITPPPFTLTWKWKLENYPAAITVESEYGAEKVTPRRGRIQVESGTEQTFDAPEFVYLNRDFEELDSIGSIDGDPEKIAHYRARNVGYSIDGGGTQGAERFFTETITRNVKINWKWELDYAVFIESGTGQTGEELDEPIGEPVPRNGRIWVARDTEMAAAIDRVVESEDAGLRAAVSGYEVTNRKGPPIEYPGDFFWKLRESDVGLLERDAVIDTPPLTGATIAFWGKIDRKLDGPRDQIFLSLFNVSDPDQIHGSDFKELQDLGLDKEKRIHNVTTIGVRPDGQFFVEEVVQNSLGQYRLRELARVPSALVGLDWHHWAIRYDFSASNRSVVIFRDGVQVFDQGLAIPSDTNPALPSYKPRILAGETKQVLLGSAIYLSNLRTEEITTATPQEPGDPPATISIATGDTTYEKFEGSINNLMIWSVAKSDGDISEHARSRQTANFDTNEPDTIYALHCDDLPATTTQGIERLPFPAAAAEALREPSKRITVNGTANRVVTESEIIQDWLKIRWLWNGQIRYRFDAHGNELGGSSQQYDDHSFLKVYNAAGTAVESTHFGRGQSTDVWIDTGRKVEVGAYYRTVDRCSTLGDFLTRPGGDLGSLGTDISALDDRSVGGRLARVVTTDAAETPTEIHWIYQPTVFRAELPLGEGLDALNANAVLVPPLCVGAELRAGIAGPDEGAFLRVGNDGYDGEAIGSPVRWDRLAKTLFPVHPGSYQFDWPDANVPGKSYRIEIVSGFPGDTVRLASEREDEDGRRQRPEPPVDGGGSPIYVTTAQLADADDSFPASPGAHYRHLSDQASGRRAPTLLDGSASDQWFFRDMTYTDATTKALVGNDEGRSFAAEGAGRSVLLYNYRPQPDEVANGDASEEQLAVRVVRSERGVPVEAGATVLGRRALRLDGASDLGVVGPGVTLNPGNNFVVDFWMDTSGFGDDASPVKVVDIGGGEFAITLTAAGGGMPARIGAEYFGISVESTVPMTGTDWHHVTVHAFETDIFGFIPVTLLDLYIDGVPVENGSFTSMLENVPPTSYVAAAGVTADSLRLGVGATASSALQIDQLRLFSLPETENFNLGLDEVERLRVSRSTELRDASASLQFSFEAEPIAGRFANEGTNGTIGLGLVPTDPSGLAEVWQRINLQEVAVRLQSTFDKAGFGSGYILNEASNFNANLYQRTAPIGAWGPIYPVNHGLLFTDPARRLEIAYYENPHGDFVDSNAFLHPNVAWPYQVVAYDSVTFPEVGPHKDKRIYIASRVGSEGVDQNGKLQAIYDLASFENLQVYHQPERAAAGFNPNDEHALIAASNRSALRVKRLGEDIAAHPSVAAFALQKDVNLTDELRPTEYTSEPWVLVQVDNLLTGEPEMAAYKVEDVRTGTITLSPRPSDALVAATPGLQYEDAATPELRFLVADPATAINFSYQFNYTASVGDLLIPPYPLNLVIGNLTMVDDRGGNIQVDGRRQRALWRDVNGRAWVVSGDGKFFHQFFYPFRGDFYLPGADGVEIGTPVAWLPEGGGGFLGDNLVGAPDSDDSPKPTKVNYTTSWRSNYPKLKRGETLTYQGGEYFNETPGANGLPALVAMGAAEIVFDAATPEMVLNDANVDSYSARIIRPLDRREVRFTIAKMAAAGFTPSARDKLLIIAERWYFKELPGSLQRRFYFDSLAEKLVFRGFLNDKDSGDPDLTSGPDPVNVIEPNVLTFDDLVSLANLSSDADWTTAIRDIFRKSQSPNPVRRLVDGAATEIDTDGRYLAGVQELPQVSLTNGELTDEEREALKRQQEIITEIGKRWEVESLGSSVGATPEPTPPAEQGTFIPLNSLGVGASLIPNPQLLTREINGALYLTIAENNRRELDGAPVSLHIIEIVPDRYRGAIKVIEGADAFSEKVTLQHSGDFGANTGDLYYEWWIRDAANLDDVAAEVMADATLREVDAQGVSLWQQYLPKARVEDSALNNFQKHLGLHTIVFEGRPDVTLVDKLVLMRYRHESESDWRLVPFEFGNPAVAWKPGTPQSGDNAKAPFQWAGAANSPQLQADGSKRYIPQLVMGWVKRVLDRINPYEARYTDFFSNESPATYSSQIQIAGAPFSGKVALNPDKNVIENTGLIELYETVLQRARELSIDNSTNPVATDGINQALLLAATRLSVLYELLAREAYSDAQDSVITVTDGDGLGGVASFTHAFQNMEASLLHEDLALLRGTDFLKSYPVYNRIFWNYAKGLGEAAYNINYNIYDENSDGFINEDDARALYPQGHGDSWGHFVSALDKHYTLLQHRSFNWRTRSELYSLMQNVLEVDYLDEKTFAKLAAGKARAGRDIVRGTYRLHYTEDPDGQWQGYTDGANPARAWGVSEWATRAGQGALFDWAVANALLPEKADLDPDTPSGDPENLDRIERLGAEDEIGEVAGGYHEIQVAMDEANGGVNPLGFDSEALSFDIDPQIFDGGFFGNTTHFEQVYDRALVAGRNAVETLEFTTKVENKLRHIADDTDALIVEAFRQDLDYRNRLIEIFGRPYDGTIGFGKIYPEGYEGPDTLLFSYLDRTKVVQIVPDGTGGTTPGDETSFNAVEIKALLNGLSDDQNLVALFRNAFAGDAGDGQLNNAIDTFITGRSYVNPLGHLSELPLRRTSAYAFQSVPDWGQRTSYGRVQQILEEMLKEEIALQKAVDEYTAFLGDFHTYVLTLLKEVDKANARERLGDNIQRIRVGTTATITAANAALAISQATFATAKSAAEAAREGLPLVNGFSNDLTSGLRAVAAAAKQASDDSDAAANTVAEAVANVAELVRDELVAEYERDLERTDQVAAIEGWMAEIELFSGDEAPKRDLIGMHLQELEIKRQALVTAQSEGFRLLREREAFNKVLAAKVQKNRYNDMVYRLSRNEAMSKYQSAFNNAARYVWLATRAYDYETSLDPGDPAAPGALLDKIVKERQLGLWSGGEPQAGQGGLAEILASLNGNFQVLKGQLGLNNPQSETEKLSLRRELFRIAPDGDLQVNSASDDRWKDALKARIVPDLTAMPEFSRYCRPFSTPEEGAQPGIVIRFSSHINNGVNFFGRTIAAGDHRYSTANFATKVRGFGVWLENYNAAGLATSPRAYMVPVGNDYLRLSSADQPTVRRWGVQEQRIPMPFVLNQANITSPGFIPTLNGVDGGFAQLRRHGDFRIYHDDGGAVDESELVYDSRLIGRSVWNSEWLLIIPGAGLHADPLTGLTQLADNISDIKLQFQTYSHQGQ